MKNCALSLLLAALVIAPAHSAAAKPNPSDQEQRAVECEMTFELNSWSAIYKSAKGEGVITCDDGEELAVVLRAKGLGLTFGKSRIVEGSGRFSELLGIEDALGTYIAAEAHAGAVESAEALALTKGPVSLALAGTGQGFDLGLAVSRFKIKKKR